jgi:serine/threonine protein kinase
MQELAKLSIVHRDLAARNILLDKWIQAKVGDFGLAREGGEYSNARTKFPVRWTAPEALKYKVFTVQRLDTQMIGAHSLSPRSLFIFLSPLSVSLSLSSHSIFISLSLSYCLLSLFTDIFSFPLILYVIYFCILFTFFDFSVSLSFFSEDIFENTWNSW